MFIPANLLQERPRHIDFPVNFAQFLKTLFIENLLVAASAPCRDFVIFQILANFNKSFFIFLLWSLFLCKPSFVILGFLRLVIVWKQTFSRRIFSKNTAHIEAVAQKTCSLKKGILVKFVKHRKKIKTCVGVPF